MESKNKKFTSEEAIVKMLFEKGIQSESEILDVLNFIKALSHMNREYDMCLSMTSAKQNIETTDDFEITLKNMESGARYDLKLVFALMTGIELKLNPVAEKEVE
ncbi:MAG: hypothetical protein ACRCW9_01865 [Cetobacterium sp.]